MRNLIYPARLLLLLLILSAHIQCSGSRASVQESEAVSPAGQDLESLCQALVATISSGDLAHIAAYYPEAGVARSLSAESASMTDEQIREQMLQPMQERLEQNIQNIMDDAEQKGLAGGSISLLDWKTEPVEEGGPPVQVVSVRLGEQPGLSGRIPLTFMELEGRIYIFEILFSTDTFKPHDD